MLEGHACCIMFPHFRKWQSAYPVSSDGVPYLVLISHHIMLHLHYVPISWKVLGLTSRWTVGNMPRILSKYSQKMNVKNICAKTATIYLEKFKSSSVYLIAMTYKNVFPKLFANFLHCRFEEICNLAVHFKKPNNLIYKPAFPWLNILIRLGMKGGSTVGWVLLRTEQTSPLLTNSKTVDWKINVGCFKGQRWKLLLNV